MKQLILTTSGDLSTLVLRLTAGTIMLVHGLQKSFGLFGGFGFRASMNYFTGTMKLPWIVALSVIVVETLCPLCLMIGMLSRLCALALVVVMIGAIVTTNAKNGLFMNWYGTQAGEGYEYHLLFIGICIAIVISGGGKFSVDELQKICDQR